MGAVRSSDTDALTAAFTEARAAGDVAAMTAAALGLPLGQRFGVHPGQVPAMLHEAYGATAEPADRCRLAAALARSWVYGGDARKALRFADEAVLLADGIGEPALVADALDAALAAHWGPDDLSVRLSLAARLDDTAAHLADVDLRLRSHLWRLTTAWECLDILSVHRQLRALDLLAEESASPRVAFFAASRRAMLALAAGEWPLAGELITRTDELGAASGEPDGDAVLHSLRSGLARQRGDLEALRAEAEAYDAFGTSEGIPSIAAEGAVLWLAAGNATRAEVLADQLVPDGFGAIPRDVDFLLTATCVLRVAADLGRRDLVADGFAVLTPYAGRGVLNAGAVAFHGVVDDYLGRAAAVLDDPAAAGWRERAASAYRRIGAAWWQAQAGAGSAVPPAARTLHLHPGPTGGWVVGPPGGWSTIPDAKGLHYLRELVRHPGVDIAAATLSATAAGHAAETVAESGLGEIVDRQALAAYRRRLDRIDGELDEADARGDQAGAARLHAERDALLDQVRSATGLGGRPRTTGSTDERARTAVRKAVSTAVRRIEAHDPALARLLLDTIRTGTMCRYDPQPDRPITWITE